MYDRDRPHPAVYDYGGQYGYHVGSQYEPGLDITEIAKRVRTGIKAAIASGTLPPLKTRVRISRFSGGQSLGVRVLEAPASCYAIDRVREELALEAAGRQACGARSGCYSSQGVAVLDALKAAVDAYNYDRSDVQTDYFDVNFYSNVDFDYQWEHATRLALRAALSGGLSPALSTATDLAPALGGRAVTP